MLREALDGPEVQSLRGPAIEVKCLGSCAQAAASIRGENTALMRRETILTHPDAARVQKGGWGGRIRTSGWEIQSLLAYHLPTPQNLPTCRSRRGTVV